MQGVNEFLETYGFKLPASSQEHKAMSQVIDAARTDGSSANVVRRFDDAPAHNMSTYHFAKKFLEAWAVGCCRKHLDVWAARFRCRMADDVFPCKLTRALAAHKQAGDNLRPGKAVPLEAGKSTAFGSYVADGAAVSVIVSTPAGDVRYTPQSVANWLHQTLADVYLCLRELLDGRGQFNVRGEYKQRDIDGDCRRAQVPASGGQLVMAYGTELGARRHQAMVAWDYDVDLVAFVTPGFDFDSIWRQAERVLKPLGLRLYAWNPGKNYRVCPDRALAWAPRKELYQETREMNPGKSRAWLQHRVRERWENGERAAHPHGANCLDLEVYVVKPGKPMLITGLKEPRPVQLAALFPVTDAFFGPLRLQVPRTPVLLRMDYGCQWRQKHVVHVITDRGGVQQQDLTGAGWRHSVWPSVPLRRCEALLS